MDEKFRILERKYHADLNDKNLQAQYLNALQRAGNQTAHQKEIKRIQQREYAAFVHRQETLCSQWSGFYGLKPSSGRVYVSRVEGKRPVYGRTMTNTYPTPYQDHPSVWILDQKAACFVSQPYNFDAGNFGSDPKLTECVNFANQRNIVDAGCQASYAP